MESNNSDKRLVHPKFSKENVNKAAKNIAKCLQEKTPIEEQDEKIVENWRTSHTHVLNTWQIILRNRIKKFKHSKIIFVQRLKRRNTIYDKLKRYPDMKLARMHDIAGCRLIFENKNELYAYIETLQGPQQFKHKRKEYESKDYIKDPKPISGYRGVHDVFLYKSRPGDDRSVKWDSLLVEIQYRTIYQHAWATAVEVADSLTNGRAKFSEGDDKQQEFFKLASEIIARAWEDDYSCKKDLTNSELITRFLTLEAEILLLSRLKQIKIIHKNRSKIKEKNMIIIFANENMENPKIEIRGCNSLKKANEMYLKLEKERPKEDIVLVTSDDKHFNNSIKEAYKNYFANTTDFTGYVEKGLEILAKK